MIVPLNILKEYADDSVAMANLWVARNLSFLSELRLGDLKGRSEMESCLNGES